MENNEVSTTIKSQKAMFSLPKWHHEQCGGNKTTCFKIDKFLADITGYSFNTTLPALQTVQMYLKWALCLILLCSQQAATQQLDEK